MNSETSNIISLNSRVRHRKVGDEGVVVCMHNGQVLIVNEVGIHILEQLQQPQVEADLVKSISHTFAIDSKQAKTDLGVYLSELTGQGVIFLTNADGHSGGISNDV